MNGQTTAKRYIPTAGMVGESSTYRASPKTIFAYSEAPVIPREERQSAEGLLDPTQQREEAFYEHCDSG